MQISKQAIKVGDDIKVYSNIDHYWRMGKVTRVAKFRYVGVMFYDSSVRYIPWKALWTKHKRLDNVG